MMDPTFVAERLVDERRADLARSSQQKRQATTRWRRLTGRR